MKHILSFATLMVLISSISYSQNEFEPGYYINNKQQKTICYIKNEGWKNNPSQIQIRRTKGAPIETLKLEDLTEFKIGAQYKFIRKLVEIDRSSDEVSRLSNSRNPEFRYEELLLKVVIEGEASLYQYNGANTERFFYTSPVRDEPAQLVYKKYKVDEMVQAEGSSELLKLKGIATNNGFQQQLLTELPCQYSSQQQYLVLRYTKKSLMKYFKDYHACREAPFTIYGEVDEKFSFAATLRVGLNTSKVDTENDTGDFRSVEFDSQTSVRLSTEFELILPFNNGKWGVIVEPTYQSFSESDSRETTSLEGGLINSEITYSSIELPIGLRHYFFLAKDVKFFLNVSYVIDFARSSSRVTFTRRDDSILSESNIDSNGNLAFGGGFTFGDLLTLEARQHTGRNIQTGVAVWNASYHTFSLILGVTVFRTKGQRER